MNIYSLYCLLTVDHQHKQNLIISEDKTNIVFPMLKIEHPRMLENELRYNIKSMLVKNTYNLDIIKNITFSYTDIQNELVLKYLENNCPDKFDSTQDLIILCVAFLDEALPLKEYSWNKFEFKKSLLEMDIVTAIIDFAVQKSIL